MEYKQAGSSDFRQVNNRVEWSLHPSEEASLGLYGIHPSEEASYFNLLRSVETA